MRQGRRSGILSIPSAGFGPARPQEDIVLTERVDGVASTQPARAAGTLAHSATASQEALDLVLISLDDDKAEDVVSIPLKGKSEMADHMVIASGRSSRQVSAIADHLLDKIKALTGQSARVEGQETGDWVLIDAGDVIVNIFRPEVREFYQLEKMWHSPDELMARH